VTRYRLDNLDCASCAAEIEGRLKGLPGVRSANVDFATATLSIDTDDTERALAEMRAVEPEVRATAVASEAAGEPAGGARWADAAERRRRTADLAILGLSIPLFLVGTVFESRLHQTAGSWAEYAVLLSAWLACGWNVLWSAVRGVIRGRVFDESFLMTVATAGAIAVHQLPEAAGVMLFYKVGELLQQLSVSRSRRSVRALLATRPDYANVRRDGRIERADPSAVIPGEEVVVRVGERVPVDGVVIEGSSSLDTSVLTGESVPREVGPGDEAPAGTINLSAALAVRSTRPFARSSIARVMELVESAVSRKAKTELFFTRFARVYTPAVVGAAILVAVIPPLLVPGAAFADWLYRALILLVISCPCALVASIPLTYFGGVGGASRRGVLVKGSSSLDALAAVDTVVFDKTGTLTRGSFEVVRLAPEVGTSPEELLALAALAESHSNHPIARSILRAAGSESPADPIAAYEEIRGEGVRATIGSRRIVAGNDTLLHREAVKHDQCDVPGTVVHVAVDGSYKGYVVVGDRLRPDAPEAVRRLRASGVREIHLLTGDGEAAAREVAAEAGVDGYRAGLLPEQKVEALEEIMARRRGGRREGRRVAFVGDGVNDAPVIARADVGIAMGQGGSEAAVETADVVLMTDSPLRVADAITHARFTRRLVRQNVLMALGVKALFVVLGVAGVATMWEAVFADMGVALAAILNATRAFSRVSRAA
jgi:Zn2+/Cd2+-exporting ATPase